MEIKVNVINEMKKLRETAYSDRTSWVEELIQNSQRANATRVLIEIGKDKFIFEDNGIGCTDPSMLFEKSTSGWDTSVTSQNPFGEGFFSTLMVADLITVESVGFKAIFDVQEMFSNGNLDCIKVVSSRKKRGFKIYLERLRPEYSPYDVEKKIEKVTEYIHSINFGVKTHERNVITTMSKKNFTDDNGSKFAMKYNTSSVVGWISPFVCPEDGWDGDHINIYVQERFVKRLYMYGVSGILHVDSNVIDLRSPDRKDIISNNKFSKFMDKLRDMRKASMENILVNGNDDDIDNYSSVICNVLDTEEYSKYMRFIYSTDNVAIDIINKELGVEKNEDNEDNAICIGDLLECTSKVEIGNVGSIEISSSIVDTTPEKIEAGRTGRGIDKTDVFYVNKSDISMYQDSIQLAEYYNIPVIIARNKLEVNTLISLGIPSIDSMEEIVSIHLDIENVGVLDAVEQRVMQIFEVISKVCGFNNNIFSIGDLHATRKTNIQGKEVKEEEFPSLAVAQNGHIYVDREQLVLDDIIGSITGCVADGEKKFIINNIDVIAHELAHVMYETVDNTKEHAEMQLEIIYKILKSLY